MNFERVDEHIRMLRTFLKAELDDDLAHSERCLAEAIADGNEGARMFYQEYLDRLKARRAHFEELGRGAA